MIQHSPVFQNRSIMEERLHERGACMAPMNLIRHNNNSSLDGVPAQCKSQLDRLSSISIAVQLSSGIPVLHTFEYRVRSIEYRDKYIYKRVVLYTTPYPCPYIQPYLYNHILKIQPVLLTALYRTVLAHPTVDPHHQPPWCSRMDPP